MSVNSPDHIWMKSGIVAGIIAAVLLPAAAIADHFHTDVPKGHIAHDAALALEQAGIAPEDCDSGTAGDQFCPGLFQNRGRASQWLHRGLGRIAQSTVKVNTSITNSTTRATEYAYRAGDSNRRGLRLRPEREPVRGNYGPAEFSLTLGPFVPMMRAKL